MRAAKAFVALVTRYRCKFCTLSFGATKVGGRCIRVHLKHFIGTSVEIQSDPLRACIHAQLEHHPAEDDDEGWDMWGRAVINVRGG